MAPYCVSSFLEMEVEETRSTASTKKLQELIRRWSLDRLITPKGLPLVEALGYAQQIASALAGAHAAGIVHRDIKPANAIVTLEGHVRVVDFGLAKLTERVRGR